MEEIFKDKIDKLVEELKKSRPLYNDQVKQLKEYYRIGLTYSSNALEGNTLTEVETKVVIENGITIGGKPIKDHLEALGHSKAFDYMYDILSTGHILEVNIKKLHELFYSTIDSATAGKYRTVQVFISGTEYLPPEHSTVPKLMKNFIAEIPLKKESLHPVDFASWLHLEFVTIHPFVDGNGRCARLLTNLALMREGYPIIIIPPILRKDYLESIIVSQNKGNKEPFYNFMAEVIVESLKDYKRLLRL